jgi:NhaP-type Na+/H+ or K+/H+ antiporter
VGVIVTGVLTAVAAWLLLDVSWAIAFLLGAILVVSGPTVVGPLLQFIRPSKAVNTVLRWEGTLIDPIGAVLGVVTFQAVLNGSLGSGGEVGDFLLAIAIGIGFGLAGTLVLVLLVRLLKLDVGQSLSAAIVVVLAVVALADILSDDSGLLATLIMGVIVANVYFDPARRERTRGATVEFSKSIKRFHQRIGGISTLLIGMLFIILSSRVSVDDIRDLGLVVVGFVAVLVLLVRPIAVALWTFGSSLSARERGFVAWMAPRGIIAAATSSSFALSLEMAGVDGAEKVFPITFVVIVGTALVYGLTGKPMATVLGVAQRGPAGVLLNGASTLVLRLAKALASTGVQVLVAPLGREVDPEEARGISLYTEDMLTELGSSKPSELDGVGSVLMMSDSDELNSVLATDLAAFGGGGRVYQLAPEDPDDSGRGSFFERAPLLFDRGATYAELSRRIEAGQTISTTAIESGAPAAGPNGPAVPGTPLFVLTPGKRLDVVTADAPARPRAGQVVISLAPPS